MLDSPAGGGYYAREWEKVEYSGIKSHVILEKIMSRFRGQIPHTMDRKGRVSIPASFREVLRQRDHQKLVITHADKCLVAYPPDEWEKLEDRILQLPQLSREVKEYQRTFLSAGRDCDLDAQGRVLIPPELRSRVGLGGKVLFVGMLTYFEIWDLAVFEQEHGPKRENIEEMEHRLATQYGI